MAEPTPEKAKAERVINLDQIVSANAFLDVQLGDAVERLQVSARFGAKVEDIVMTAMNLVEAIGKLRETYPKPTSIPASQPAVEEPKKKFELKPVPDAEKPPELPEGIEVYKDEFDRFVIEPKPDMKCSVKFYKDKLKWPVGAQINNWKNETVAQHLFPFGEFDLTKAQEKRVSGVMYWSKGSEYIIKDGERKGEKSHYKDLRLIQANL
jgi:hypothetical protein